MRPERFDRDTRLTADGTHIDVLCSGPPARVHVVLTYERGRFGAGDELQVFEELVFVDEVRTLE